LDVTNVVKIYVDAAIVLECEIADGVGALNGIRIRVPGLCEPGIFGLDKVAGVLVGPELRELSVR
jgi:hypothetical protein